MIWFAVFIAFLYLGVILFLRAGLLKIARKNSSDPLTFSIVIAARNEEENIRECLDSIFSQTVKLDRYEVIVVNDRSTDATAAILEEFQGRFANFSVITVSDVPSGMSPKKHAVSKGVDAARNEIIVFTDADCVVPPTWLTSINTYFSSDVGLVQGITSYRYISGMNKLFFGLQAVDFLSHGIVAAAAIGANLPINSNANNFAFRKKVFQEIDGYGDTAGRVVSGDDDLLLQRVWKSKKWRVVFMADSAATVHTNPTPTISQAFEQRKRWGSKTVHYCAPQVALLSSVFIFYLLILISAVLSPFQTSFLPVLLGSALVKVFGESLLMIPGTRIFGKTELRPYIPLASLIQLPVVVSAVFMGVFGRFGWKGQSFKRTVKRESQL